MVELHFACGITTLLVYRLLEVRLDDQMTHITPQNLITTLRNMNVTNIHDLEYMALYSGSKTLDALSQLTDLDLGRLHYRSKELHGKIKNLLK